MTSYSNSNESAPVTFVTTRNAVVSGSATNASTAVPSVVAVEREMSAANIGVSTAVTRNITTGSVGLDTEADITVTVSQMGSVCVLPCSKMAAVSPLQDLSTPTNTITSDEYDCDSLLSDGHEKTDTTPENIKKIDDVIELRSAAAAAAYKHANYQRSLTTAAAVSAASAAIDPIYVRNLNVGLDLNVSPALDEPQHAKFCLSAPLCSKKDAFCRSEHESNVTPSAAASAHKRSNAGNSSDDDEIKADSSDAHDDDSSISNNTATNAAAMNKQHSCAFTIDNFNDKDCDPAAAAAKYKNMLERFQNRHRRGASMSKLEAANKTQAERQHRNSYRSQAEGNCNSFEGESDVSGAATTPITKVKLRVRDRSTSRVRDASKRHSWSPRSSTQELIHTQAETQSQAQDMPKVSQLPTYHPTKAMPVVAPRGNAAQNKHPPLKTPKGAANLLASRSNFMPRSTAMQMALQDVDFICPKPPLSEFKHLTQEIDNVSETGTYTLDGDNYTEEQKDLMNIDRSNKERKPNRPKNLNLQINDMESMPNQSICSNVLEVNYYDEAVELMPAPAARSKSNANDFLMDSHQTAEAYLKKIKLRVLHGTCESKSTAASDGGDDVCIGDGSHNHGSFEEEDVGCFTSVTTSGVLAKQSGLHTRPKISRKDSLSTSQIDSSEYVSNQAKLKSATAITYAAGGFTDRQKSEYRLNLFTNQKDIQQLPMMRSMRDSPPDSPTTQHSDAAVLQSAQSKNDWIQEWARNARARSLATDSKCSQAKTEMQELMTRSYTCADTGADSLTDDSIYNNQCMAKLNRTLTDRYRLAGDCDYSSDPAQSNVGKPIRDVNCKPPKSPSKIPSPMHSIGRARSASRARGSLHDMLQADEEDIYLQKTAAAINNLQQSLSRKNSLLSPTHSASPRVPNSSRPPTLHSSEECSPQHSCEGYANSSPRHRRNASGDVFVRSTRPYGLMTSSINEQQLKLLTSGEYLAKQMRLRKNSFDGSPCNSPVRRIDKYAGAQPLAKTENCDQQILSPLRRSSSFSTKIATHHHQQHHRPARSQFQNIYTPPAARHNYTLASGQVLPTANLNLKKSSSSNSFRQAYGDFDEIAPYYINDEDDVGEEYYSSGAEDEEPTAYGDQYYTDIHESLQREQDAPAALFANTRYNKALLMRIERSKQKVASKQLTTPVSKMVTNASAGVVACPNTPELPRRVVKSAPRVRGTRQSMPRDTSLNRLANQVPNSLDSAKKQLLQTAAAVPVAGKTLNQRVQPKYMDISKYKTGQSNNFLRKNDAKSTLKTPALDTMKRSTSIATTGLNRTDASRMSNRSMKSMMSCMNTSTTSSTGSGRASSAARRDASATKQKEAEMAMWKRRSTYDPMKAAAEDRRKKEEAKRLAMAKVPGEVPCESMEMMYTRNPADFNDDHTRTGNLTEEKWTLGNEAGYHEPK